MTAPEFIEAFLESWMVESGEFPELQVGQDAEMSLCAHVRALDGVGEVPASATLHTRVPARELEGVVTWVRNDKQGLNLVVQHAGVLLATEPGVCEGRRRPTWRERLRGYRGIPEFLPVLLPVPEIGQVVSLQCIIGVMADYDLEEIWPGPDVSAHYRVERIDAEVVTPQPLPAGTDEFDDVPDLPSRTVTGLSSTRPPPDLVELDITEHGEFSGEDVSSYRLLLTPVDPLP